jgi:hypothetical protein
MKKYLCVIGSYQDLIEGQVYEEKNGALATSSNNIFYEEYIRDYLIDVNLIPVTTFEKDGHEWINFPLVYRPCMEKWVFLSRNFKDINQEGYRILSTGGDSFSDDHNATAPDESLPESNIAEWSKVQERDCRDASPEELRYEAKKLIEIANSIVDDVNNKAPKPFPSKALSLTDELPMMLGGKWGGTHD